MKKRKIWGDRGNWEVETPMGKKGIELLLTDVYTKLMRFLKEERSTVDGHFFGGKIRIEPVLTNLNEERVWENLKEKK